MLRRRTDPIPGGLGEGWVIRATAGSRFIGWLTVKSVIPDRERKIGCNENPRRRAEFLRSALPFTFDQGDECTLPRNLRRGTLSATCRRPASDSTRGPVICRLSGSNSSGRLMDLPVSGGK